MPGKAGDPKDTHTMGGNTSSTLRQTLDWDTAMPVPAILALKLKEQGKDVDFAAAWGKGHAGDYDLEELFAWIDSICK